MEQYTELAEETPLSLISAYTEAVQDFGGRIEQIIRKGDDYLIIYSAKNKICFGFALDIHFAENEFDIN